MTHPTKKPSTTKKLLSLGAKTLAVAGVGIGAYEAASHLGNDSENDMDEPRTNTNAPVMQQAATNAPPNNDLFQFSRDWQQYLKDKDTDEKTNIPGIGQ